MSYFDEFNVFAVENLTYPIDALNFSINDIKSISRPILIHSNIAGNLALTQLKDLMSRHVDRSINYKRIRKEIVQEYGEDSWYPPEYDLEEVTTLLDVESYVKRAYKKRMAHMFKEGWVIDSESERNVEYVEKRLAEIAFFTNVSTLELFKSIAKDFLTKSTAIIVKVRRKGLGSGVARRSLDGRKLDPIVGYFPVDPAYTEAQFDKFHNIKRYRIYTSDKSHYSEFPAEDVIHLTREQKYNEWCGTPDMVSAAPDIATLRQIEENIELYFYQHLFPLYHYKVGTEDQDASLYPDGTREIDVVREEIQYMPTEGCIVTPFRHEIVPLEQRGRFAAIKEIHDIFKKRVFAALGMSDIDFGEGNTTTRASAGTLSLQLIDDVKDDLHTLEDLVQKEIFTELLLEAPFAYNPFKKEEQVKLVFPDPDKEGRLQLMKVLVDATDKNILSLDEARLELGYRAFEKSVWKNTAWGKYQKELAQIEHPATQSTETIAHTKDDSTPVQPPSVPGQPKRAPMPKPPPTVTTTVKKVNKSTIMDLFDSLVEAPNSFNEIVGQIAYYIPNENCLILVKEHFKYTHELITKCGSPDELVYVAVGRRDLLSILLDEYIINEELVQNQQ